MTESEREQLIVIRNTMEMLLHMLGTGKFSKSDFENLRVGYVDAVEIAMRRPDDDD